MSAGAPAQRASSPRVDLQRVIWTVALLLAGGLQAAALAFPGSGQPLWWLQIASLAVLCGGLQQAHTPRQAAVRAWWFAMAWLCGTFWWLFISMHTYAGLAAPLAVLAIAALAAFLASYYALAAWAWQRWRPAAGWLQTLGFAALWTLAELARGYLWTGFPWGAGGYAHVEGPLSLWPQWIGVYGTGAIAAWLAMGAATLALHRTWRSRAAWGSVGALALAWLGIAGQSHTAPDAPLRAPVPVALLQGNIPQDEKFVPGAGIPLALEWYAEQLHRPFEGLVVAPETAIPVLPQQLSPEYLPQLGYAYGGDGQSTRAALIGIPLGTPEEGFTNSVIGLYNGRDVYRYDKHHLVPFGEFIPPLFAWFVRMMQIPLGDFHRGDVAQASLAWGGERWAPNICYEDLFGEEIGQRFVDAAQAPSVLVNLSNIGWFGDSLAIDQHLHISRMRSLEFARDSIRATNTGATAVIDHQGRVTALLPPATRGVLHAQVQGRDGITPYAWWVSRAGLWPLGLLCALVVLGLRWQARRGRADR